MQIFERHFQMNYSVGVRGGFTLVCLMICIWRVNRIPDPVLRGQPCRSRTKNGWCLSSLIAFKINRSVTPVVIPVPVKVPFTQREKVQEELDRIRKTFLSAKLIDQLSEFIL